MSDIGNVYSYVNTNGYSVQVVDHVLTFKGTYTTEETYLPRNVVDYANDQYVNLVTSVGTGSYGRVPPTDLSKNSYWSGLVLIQRGTAPATTVSAAKIYRVLLSQDGSSDPPTAIELENTLGAIVWTRIGAGEYQGTLAGAFPADKTFTMINTRLDFVNQGGISISLGGVNFVNVLTVDSGVNSDGLLQHTSVEILVYS